MSYESEGKTKSITLVLTHQCNLRCTYCYELHKGNERMSFEMAMSIIDKEMRMDDGTDMVEIDLFGGEPLLEFETIKRLVEETKKKDYEKAFIFFITTNGVLLTEPRKKWLRENADLLQIGLSLDGTREMHNVNRGDCFDKIDLAFFRDTYPEQSVKMTISRETLPQLAEGIIFAHEFGFKVSANLAYGIDWDDEKYRKMYSEQLTLLIDYYLAHPEVEPCALFEINRIKSMSYQMEDNLRYCGAGIHMKAYDYDGTFYPCQHFLPLSIGKEQAQESLKIDFGGGYSFDFSKQNPMCRECVIKNVCPTCYGENFSSTGDIYKRDVKLCEMHKIQFEALAYFAMKLFLSGRLNDLPKKDSAAILKSALMIQKGLNDSHEGRDA
ncbi:MAG: radical SAM protein [Bacillota bacterium]|nr:radical SAM protein [Bacillota bacterium]